MLQEIRPLHRYTDEMRECVLLVAKLSENKPLEAYSHSEKRAIATAIITINNFSFADQALIGREKSKWKRLYQTD